MAKTPIVPANPLALSLTAQRFFNQNLLLALIETGALNQQKAGAIAGKTASEIRDFEGKNETDFGAALAKTFETVAADILGLPPLAHEPKI